MAPEAFVCPHCRTWVEGEGRSIRCPSCGKRFRADEARLNRPRTPAGFEEPDFEVPPQDGWDFGDSTRSQTDTEMVAEPEHDRWLPDDTTSPASTDVAGETRRPGWDETVSTTSQQPQSTEPSPDETATGEGTTSEPEEQGIPWRWIMSIALLVLIFVGGRFLSGELFIVAFLALIAAQWFLERGKNEG